MKHVVVLTPDPADEAFSGRWRDVFERMAPPLRDEGVDLSGASWVEPGDLSGADLVLPLTVWGYHRAFRRWVEAVEALAAAGVPLANPASVLRWNADKLYLERLAAAGAPIIPTVFLDRPSSEQVGAAAERFGTDRLIVKPQVSANAYRTLRLRPGESLDGAPDGACMVQPYLPSIETEGEHSLIFFEGRFSHAIRKAPRAGDFRVQPEYGSTIVGGTPPKDVLDAAFRVLTVVEEPLLYARVDLVRDLEGRPALIELELIEPDLYLNHDPSEGAAFARAVRDRLG